MEWRLDPVYICNNWSRELFDLMLSKLSDRHKPHEAVGAMTDKQLMKKLGVKVQKRKKTK